MPRFSQSLFESIRNFGRMSPTEGRRQALQQQSPYQQMGTTDPLARNIGRMFGGLGADTSYLQTGEERAQAAMQKAGQQEFASPEARMIAMLEAQMPTLRPAAQMQAMDQIRQLREIERQRAAAEAEKRKAQQKADEEALIARAEAESESRSNRDLALAIKDKFPRVAAAVMRGDKDAKEFAYKALENRLQKKDIDTADWQFGSATDRMQDSKGNEYLVNTRRNTRTGRVEPVYSPLGDAPEYDAAKQGDLTFISRTGETVDEKTRRELENKAKEEWQTERGKILTEYSKAPEVVEKAERAIAALDNINTSGFDAAIKTITDFTGTTSADVGVFNSSVSDFILESLGKLGANPTEGEREFLVEASASLKTSKQVNMALLRRVRDTYQDMIGRGKWLLENPTATKDEYVNWMLSPKQENILTFDASGNRIQD